MAIGLYQLGAVQAARPLPGRNGGARTAPGTSLKFGSTLEVYTGHVSSPRALAPGRPANYVLLPEFKSADQHKVINPFALTMDQAAFLADSLPLQESINIKVSSSLGRPGSSAVSVELAVGKSASDVNPQVSLMRVKLQSALWIATLKAVGTRTPNAEVVGDYFNKTWEVISSEVDRLIAPLNANPDHGQQRARIVYLIQYLRSANLETSSISETIARGNKQFDDMSHLMAGNKYVASGLFRPRTELSVSDGSGIDWIEDQTDIVDSVEEVVKQEEITNLEDELREIDQEIEDLEREKVEKEQDKGSDGWTEVDQWGLDDIVADLKAKRDQRAKIQGKLDQLKN